MHAGRSTRGKVCTPQSYCCYSKLTYDTARAVLNFKKLPYKTEWVEYPDLEPRFKELGIPPNPETSFAPYTSPTVRFADGSYLQDSEPIAKRLEELYPEPSLHLDEDHHQEVADAVIALVSAGVGLILPLVPRNLLNERSTKFFLEDREKRFGIHLYDLEKAKGGEQAWKDMEPKMAEFKDLLTKYKKDEGAFMLGSQISYADFHAAGLFQAFMRCGEEYGERLLSYDESFRKLFEACKPYLERDDH